MAKYDITAVGSKLQFDTVNSFNSCYKYDDNHFINFWTGASDRGYAQIFNINTNTKAVTAVGSKFEFYNSYVVLKQVVQYDDDSYLVFWGDTIKHYLIHASLVSVNPITKAITIIKTTTNILNINNNMVGFGVEKYDNDNFIIFWCDKNGYVRTQILNVDQNTKTVSAIGSPLDVMGSAMYMRDASILKYDSNNFIAFWQFNTTPYAQIFNVNPSTKAITAVGSKLEITGSRFPFCNTMDRYDNDNFIVFWHDDNGFYTQILNVNPSTKAVTTVGTKTEFDDSESNFNYGLNICHKYDDNHFINFWTGTSNRGYAQIFNVNASTKAVTAVGSKLQFDTGNYYNSCYKYDDNHFINFWTGTSNRGYAQIFEVEDDIKKVKPSNLMMMGIG